MGIPLDVVAKLAKTQNWVPSVASSNPTQPQVVLARLRPCEAAWGAVPEKSW